MVQFVKGMHVLYCGTEATVLDAGTFYEMECKFFGGPMYILEDEVTYSKTTGSLPTVVLSVNGRTEFCTKPSNLTIID